MVIKADTERSDGRKPRLSFLDNAKGITILLVVLTHVVLNCESDVNFSGGLWTYFVNTVYLFHMQLFFMISGMLFHETWPHLEKNKITGKIADKTISLMVPYFVFSLVYGIMKIILSGIARSEISPNDLIFLWLRPISVYWYIYTLALLYILFGSLQYYGRTLNAKPRSLLATGFLIAVSIVIQIVPMDASVYKTILYRVIRYAPCFALGIVLNAPVTMRYAAKIRTRKIWVIAAAVLTCSVTGLLDAKFSEYRLWVVARNLASYFLSYLIILGCFLMTKKDNGWLSWLGRNCMPVYVLHVPVIVMMKAGLKRVGIVSDWSLFCLISITAVAVPLLVQHVLRRYRPADFILYPNQYWMYGGQGGKTGREERRFKK